MATTWASVRCGRPLCFRSRGNRKRQAGDCECGNYSLWDNLRCRSGLPNAAARSVDVSPSSVPVIVAVLADTGIVRCSYTDQMRKPWLRMPAHAVSDDAGKLQR
ncbi:hypothetical protein Dda_1130 [Drechslerella dactyloides]|uniref:Uncharacterized protein n=1 Tax=Drechslerella dactyloides TaxID=74499 RepID=A0AAD6J8L5_DREDA|nr:hypothetical protein Dda_1130 [Drechslerella dactyloides]